MKFKSISILILLFSLLFVSASIINFSINNILPEGWYPAGQAPIDYEMGLDNKIYYNGKSSGFIKSIPDNPIGFGTLMQMCQAKEFIGKRIKMTGYIRAQNIEDWAGMWLRVDGPKERLKLDNMKRRPIKGSTDWEKYEIILDVPKNSVNLAFGIILDGSGKAWIDNISFEVVNDIVDSNVLPIDNQEENKLPPKPVNLNFEK